jgi:hypothetical protein
MSQPELERTLRAVRPVAPPELRERIRRLAAQPVPAARPARWRRPLALAVPLAAALAAALVATFTRDGGSPEPRSAPVAKSARAAAPGDAAGPSMAERTETGAAERTVVSTARMLGGDLVARRAIGRTVELRLRFPAAATASAARKIAALAGVVSVTAAPHGGGTVVVRVTRS